MTTTDPVTLTLTGEIPFILIASGCVGLLSSFVLLQLYRRAVRRGMARTSGNLATSQATGAARMGPPAPPTPLAIAYAGTGGRDPAVVDSSGLYSRARTAPWRSGAVYGSAGVVFAATLTSAFLWSSGTELTPLRFLVLFWVFLSPVVFSLYMVAATSRREKMFVAAGCATGCGARARAALTTTPDSSPSQLIVLWILSDLPPSLLFPAFFLRRVRGVGPLVVPFLVF